MGGVEGDERDVRQKGVNKVFALPGSGGWQCAYRPAELLGGWQRFGAGWALKRPELEAGGSVFGVSSAFGAAAVAVLSF